MIGGNGSPPPPPQAEIASTSPIAKNVFINFIFAPCLFYFGVADNTIFPALSTVTDAPGPFARQALATEEKGGKAVLMETQTLAGSFERAVTISAPWVHPARSEAARIASPTLTMWLTGSQFEGRRKVATFPPLRG